MAINPALTTPFGAFNPSDPAQSAKALTGAQPTETPEQHANRLWEERHQSNRQNLQRAAAAINDRNGSPVQAEANRLLGGMPTRQQVQNGADANARQNLLAGSAAEYNGALTQSVLNPPPPAPVAPKPLDPSVAAANEARARASNALAEKYKNQAVAATQPAARPLDPSQVRSNNARATYYNTLSGAEPSSPQEVLTPFPPAAPGAVTSPPVAQPHLTPFASGSPAAPMPTATPFVGIPRDNNGRPLSGSEIAASAGQTAQRPPSGGRAIPPTPYDPSGAIGKFYRGQDNTAEMRSMGILPPPAGGSGGAMPPGAVRSGRAPDGRRVFQFSDGSIRDERGNPL